jgi:hypothetical protein
MAGPDRRGFDALFINGARGFQGSHIMLPEITSSQQHR